MNVYTIRLARYADDDDEQGTTLENIKQVQDELQEAFNCGHLIGFFNIVAVENGVDGDTNKALHEGVLNISGQSIGDKKDQA